MKNSKKRDAKIGLAVLICMSMGIGPGLLLVNRPAFLWGIPILYAWAILWYVLLCVLAIVASRYFGSDEAEQKEGTE